MLHLNYYVGLEATWHHVECSYRIWSRFSFKFKSYISKGHTCVIIHLSNIERCNSSSLDRHCPLVTTVGIFFLLRPTKWSKRWEVFGSLPVDFRLTVKVCINPGMKGVYVCQETLDLKKKKKKICPFCPLNDFRQKVMIRSWTFCMIK